MPAGPVNTSQVTATALPVYAAGVTPARHDSSGTIGPFDSSEVAAAHRHTPPRHALSTRMTLESCDVDIPPAFADRLQILPAGTGQSLGTVAGTSIADTTLSLHVLAAPRRGSYWEDEEIGRLRDQVTAELSAVPGAMVLTVIDGFYGQELHTVIGGRRAMVQVGVSRPRWTAVASLYRAPQPAAEVTDEDILTAYELLSTLVVHRGAGPYWPGGVLPLTPIRP